MLHRVDLYVNTSLSEEHDTSVFGTTTHTTTILTIITMKISKFILTILDVTCISEISMHARREK
jgi:hypothetical protein